MFLNTGSGWWWAWGDGKRRTHDRRGLTMSGRAVTAPPHCGSLIPERVGTVVVLRGVAAFAVSWFHFTCGNPKFLEAGILKTSGQYGWLGVEVFFVISGFVIPYSLTRGGYRVADYGRFLLKRIIRLDPPYIVSLAIIIALLCLSASVSGYRGAPLQLSVKLVVLHLGYVNVLFGYPWLNPVFWTLAIELQYYVLVGLAFPVLASTSWVIRTLAITGMITLAMSVPVERFVLHWLPLFWLGVLVFHLKDGRIGVGAFIAWTGVTAVAVIITHGALVSAVVVATALALAFARLNAVGPLGFLGNVSYSLYLLHVPIGGRVINLGERLAHSTATKIIFLVGAVAASLLASWLMFRFVEQPAQQWSARLHYSGRNARSG